MINVATFGTEIWSWKYFPEAGESASFRITIFLSVQPKIIFCFYCILDTFEYLGLGPGQRKPRVR